MRINKKSNQMVKESNTQSDFIYIKANNHIFFYNINFFSPLSTICTRCTFLHLLPPIPPCLPFFLSLHLRQLKASIFMLPFSTPQKPNHFFNTKHSRIFVLDD